MKYFVFSTGSNPSLVKEIIKKSSHLKLGSVIIDRYQDGEIMVHLKEAVNGQRVYVLGSSFPPASNVLKLIILINTLKANGAKEIILLIPYFGYGKQDRVKYSGDALSAKLMVDVIRLAGVKKTIALDLHSQMVEKYFKNPLVHLNSYLLFATYFKKLIKVKDDWLVVAPDKGGEKRAQVIAQRLGYQKVTIINKVRPQVDRVKIISITGEVKNKHIIINDDMCQTGGTLIAAAKGLKALGAKDIYVSFTHLLPTGPAIANLLKDKNIKQVVFTNSVEIPKGMIKNKKFQQLSCASLFFKQIK